MSLIEYTQPEFLLCELPIKDGSFNDDRLWIYHRLSLSLIEFVCLNDIQNENFEGLNKDFIYFGNDEVDPEAWKGVFVQNNTELFELDAIEVMDKAWKFLEDYLKWEDSQ